MPLRYRNIGFALSVSCQWLMAFITVYAVPIAIADPSVGWRTWIWFWYSMPSPSHLVRQKPHVFNNKKQLRKLTRSLLKYTFPARKLAVIPSRRSISSSYLTVSAQTNLLRYWNAVMSIEFRLMWSRDEIKLVHTRNHRLRNRTWALSELSVMIETV